MTQPCDCPSTPLPVPGSTQTGLRVNYVLNYDGPQTDVYWTLAHAIPEGDLECGRPVCHPDGALEFPSGEPADLYGYTRDGTNPRLFRPVWPECIHRGFGVLIRDKQLVVAGQCNNIKADQFCHSTTLDLCSACPVRQLATVHKPKSISELVADMKARGKADIDARIAANK